MKQIHLFILISMALVFSQVTDALSFQLGGKELVKNGSGNRTIVGSMYILSLWVPEQLKGKSGKEIIEANEPMSFVLVIDSILVTRSRFVNTTKEGFDKAAASGYPAAKKQAFLDLFNNTEFNKGDIVYLNYTRAGLTTLYQAKKSEKPVNLGTIPGLDLKKALYAIWLGSNPVQKSLKDALLAGK